MRISDWSSDVCSSDLGTIAKLERSNAGALSGVLGDEHAGPAVHVIHGAAGERIVPPARWSTEIVTLVVKGSATIDGKPYGAGALRIQREDTTMGANLAGENGVEQVLVVADRRASPDFAVGAGETAWTDGVVRRRWVGRGE